MTPHLADTPVLETKRLILRAPRMEDYPVWEAFFATDRARYVGGPGGTRVAWRGFAHITGMWALKGLGTFVFTEKGSELPLGMTGPYYPEDWPEPELGWHIWPLDAEGKGYAYEAADAARNYAWSHLGWTNIVSYIDDGNDRSVALAQRLGCTLDENAARPVPEDPKKVLVYRHPAPEARP